MKYLSAVTTLGVNSPAYINFSKDEATGEVRIVGRHAPKADGSEGASFELTLPAVCVELMFEEGLRNLRAAS